MHLKQCQVTQSTKFVFHILYKPEWDLRRLILFWFVTKSCLVFDVFCQRLAKLNIVYLLYESLLSDKLQSVS